MTNGMRNFGRRKGTRMKSSFIKFYIPSVENQWYSMLLIKLINKIEEIVTIIGHGAE